MADQGYGDDEATLGDRLTAARECAGLSLDDLADKLGVRVEKLSEWEGDQDEPRAVYMGRLSGMLGVSLRWLMTGEGSGPSAGDALQAARAEAARLQQLLAEATQRLNRLEEILANG